MVMVPGATALTRTSGEGAGQAAGEHDDAGLGDGIGEIVGPGKESADGSEIDDGAAGFFQEGSSGLRGEKLGFEIGVERGIPLLFGGGFQGRGREDGGAVDKEVEAGEAGGGFLDEAADFGDLAEVGGEGKGAAAQGFDFGGGGAGGDIRAAVVEDNVGAFAGQSQGHGAAEAACAAGDEGDAAVERRSGRWHDGSRS